MAGRIKGITVEIGGDTTGLENPVLLGFRGYSLSTFDIKTTVST